MVKGQERLKISRKGGDLQGYKKREYFRGPMQKGSIKGEETWIWIAIWIKGGD